MLRTDSPRSSGARLLWPLPAILVILVAALGLGAAEKDKNEKSKDAASPDAAIRASAEAFVKAFNRGDAKAVAALWTANGTMADDRGEILRGRKAIEDQYAAFFKAYPGAKMEVSVKSIDFPAPSMAVEDGTAQVVVRQAVPPVASRYTAVHVQEDGKWLMASVRETTIPLSSNFSRLAELGWLIGTWETKRDGTIVRATFRWIEVSTSSTAREDVSDLSA